MHSVARHRTRRFASGQSGRHARLLVLHHRALVLACRRERRQNFLPRGRQESQGIFSRRQLLPQANHLLIRAALFRRRARLRLQVQVFRLQLTCQFIRGLGARLIGQVLQAFHRRLHTAAHRRVNHRRLALLNGFVHGQAGHHLAHGRKCQFLRYQRLTGIRVLRVQLVAQPA